MERAWHTCSAAWHIGVVAGAWRVHGLLAGDTVRHWEAAGWGQGAPYSMARRGWRRW